jgi:hypothetical protein
MRDFLRLDMPRFCQYLARDGFSPRDRGCAGCAIYRSSGASCLLLSLLSLYLRYHGQQRATAAIAGIVIGGDHSCCRE